VLKGSWLSRRLFVSGERRHRRRDTRQLNPAAVSSGWWRGFCGGMFLRARARRRKERNIGTENAKLNALHRCPPTTQNSSHFFHVLFCICRGWLTSAGSLLFPFLSFLLCNLQLHYSILTRPSLHFSARPPRVGHVQPLRADKRRAQARDAVYPYVLSLLYSPGTSPPITATDDIL
jgi:hypothetical protein